MKPLVFKSPLIIYTNKIMKAGAEIERAVTDGSKWYSNKALFRGKVIAGHQAHSAAFDALHTHVLTLVDEAYQAGLADGKKGQ